MQYGEYVAIYRLLEYSILSLSIDKAKIAKTHLKELHLGLETILKHYEDSLYCSDLNHTEQLQDDFKELHKSIDSLLESHVDIRISFSKETHDELIKKYGSIEAAINQLNSLVEGLEKL